MNEFRDLQDEFQIDDYTMLCVISNYLRMKPDLLIEIMSDLRSDLE